MADGYSDTWTAQASSTNVSGHARERAWNNTLNFSSVPKDLRPVNGYTDQQMSWAMRPYDYVIRYLVGGAYYQNLVGIQQPASVARSLWASTEGLTTNAWEAKLETVLNGTMVKALVKVADVKVNLAVAYAEAHKTSALIFDTAHRIDKAYRAFRKGDLKGVAENLNITPKKLHKSWLEYKYGWMPLLMDVRGSAEFFAQQVMTRKPRFTVTASDSVTQTDSFVRNNGKLGGAGADWLSHNVLIRQGTTKVKLECELSDPHYSELQQLGLTNPLLVAWELVPYSFVFDWFIQVGDYLTALSAFHGVTLIRQVAGTVVVSEVRESWPAISSQDSTYSYYCSGTDRQFGMRTYKRSPATLNPFDLKIPTSFDKFGFPKLVTSLALLQGANRSNSTYRR